MALLSRRMSVEVFDRSYWYAREIKAFARELGLPDSGRLRKDELEKMIRHFLSTGERLAPDRAIKKTQTLIKDLDLGLTMTLPIRNYTSNKITKSFILNEALKIDPTLKPKSGVWYRLNRWREDQLMHQANLTYGDLIRQFVAINKIEKFERVPVVRYINFIADYQAHEKNSTREEAIQAWKELKALDLPKTYPAWKAFRAKTK